jgi:protein-arginine kinase activator protein McsA
MNCQCCKTQKARLHTKESDIISGNKIVLCTQCLNSGHEPRHNVVLAAFSDKDVTRYVVGSLYCGEPLMANEIIH